MPKETSARRSSCGWKIRPITVSSRSGNNGAGTAASAESGRQFSSSRDRSNTSSDLKWCPISRVPKRASKSSRRAETIVSFGSSRLTAKSSRRPCRCAMELSPARSDYRKPFCGIRPTRSSTNYASLFAAAANPMSCTATSACAASRPSWPKRSLRRRLCP